MYVSVSLISQARYGSVCQKIKPKEVRQCPPPNELKILNQKMNCSGLCGPTHHIQCVRDHDMTKLYLLCALRVLLGGKTYTVFNYYKYTCKHQEYCWEVRNRPYLITTNIHVSGYIGAAVVLNSTFVSELCNYFFARFLSWIQCARTSCSKRPWRSIQL
jgi:hypothetical protein